jgi:hypothetical protein
MGSNSFTMEQKWTQLRGGGGGEDWKPGPPITVFTSGII